MKTDIYNLIILDESGSMSGVTHQTISGCNETLNTIRSAQKLHGDTQDQYVSIYAFQSGGPVPSRYLIKNRPIDEAKDITGNDYQPNGCTPLYDAVGSTLVDLKTLVDTKDFAIGAVTIITDGMENSSRQYTREKVVRMIDALKEMGWNFNFIGANIDVQGTAQSLHIDNALEFQQDDDGMKEMFRRERSSRMKYNRKVRDVMYCVPPDASASECKQGIVSRLKDAEKDYFSEEDEDDKK
ncbi:MAG: VWA domain-containing protein [Prevotella sp.]|nr:VWA domain-containing protein [Prevotella sp.]